MIQGDYNTANWFFMRYIFYEIYIYIGQQFLFNGPQIWTQHAFPKYLEVLFFEFSKFRILTPFLAKKDNFFTPNLK